MTVTHTICTSFKLEALESTPSWLQDTFKIALYTSSSALDASTTVYSATDETSGGGYDGGGQILTAKLAQISGTKAILDFADPVWTNSSFTAHQAVIYNASKAD